MKVLGSTPSENKQTHNNKRHPVHSCSQSQLPMLFGGPVALRSPSAALLPVQWQAPPGLARSRGGASGRCPSRSSRGARRLPAGSAPGGSGLRAAGRPRPPLCGSVPGRWTRSCAGLALAVGRLRTGGSSATTSQREIGCPRQRWALQVRLQRFSQGKTYPRWGETGPDSCKVRPEQAKRSRRRGVCGSGKQEEEPAPSVVFNSSYLYFILVVVRGFSWVRNC